MEVGAPNNSLEIRESESQIEDHILQNANDVVTTIGVPLEEVGSLEVAFLYDAPMREMTVRK